jgi:hypothetical protein
MPSSRQQRKISGLLTRADPAASVAAYHAQPATARTPIPG